MKIQAIIKNSATMTKEKIKAAFLVVIALILLNNMSLAQDNTMYYIHGIPGSAALNPATQPICGFYIEPPVLSQLNLNVYNSAFTVRDIVFIDESDANDSVIHPFHPRADVDEFFSLFSKTNIVSMDYSFNVASFGFRVNEMYFTFNVTPKVNTRFTYPKDFILLPLQGNSDGQSFDLSSFGINSKAYVEYGLGISRTIGDNLSVGIRPKIYTGLYAIKTDIEKLTLNTGYDQWEIQMNGQLNIANSLFEFPVDEDGVVEFDKIDSVQTETLEGDNFAKGIAKRNMGFGIDLGVHYTLIDKIKLSASVVDLGYIKWKSYTNNTVMDGSYVMEPLNLDSLNDGDNYPESILDSIQNEFAMKGNSGSFKTSMEPSVYLGVRYALDETLDFGLLSHTKFYDNHIRQDLLIVANYKPSRIFNLTATYSLLDQNKSKIGLGYSIRFGPFGMYMVMDDLSFFRYKLKDGKEDVLPMGLGIPSSQNSYNLRFGINLQFGCNKIKKQMKDKPLLHSEDSLIY